MKKTIKTILWSLLLFFLFSCSMPDNSNTLSEEKQSGTPLSSKLLNTGNLSLTEGQTPYNGAPVELPGIIEAEDYDNGGPGIAYYDTSGGNAGGEYRNDENVDLQTCSSGGYNLGWTEAGEWLEYSVNVTKGGTYSIEALITSQYTGGSFTLYSGDSQIAAFDFEATGGWQTWLPKTSGMFTLNEGTQIIRINIDKNGFNLDSLKFTIHEPGEQKPFPDPENPAVIPGLIEVENYDQGGQNIAYYDTSPGNSGGAYRTNEDVDLQTCNAGGYNLGWTEVGEWLEYTVNVTQGGNYSIEAKVSSLDQSGGFTVDIRKIINSGETETSRIADFDFGPTGGWQTWQPKTSDIFVLAEGKHIVRINIVKSGFNLDSLKFISREPQEQKPFPDPNKPAVVPGIIEAENFDRGGQGVSYFDSTSANEGGAYRLDERVDLQNCNLGGYNLGWAEPGEWLEYTIDVKDAGVYSLGARVASQDLGGHFTVELKNADETETAGIADFNFGSTGGWQTWTTYRQDDIYLNAGVQIIRINIIKGGFNLDTLGLFQYHTGSFETNVMSFNLRTLNTQYSDPEVWNVRKNRVINLINLYDPDVIGTQEGSARQFNDIMNSANGPWAQYGSILYRSDRAQLIETGIFWFSDTPDRESYGWNQDYIRFCEWALLETSGGGRYYIYNNHWTYKHVWGRELSAKLLVSRIQARTQHTAPFVVTGDMNNDTAEAESSIEYLKNGPLPMRDTFRDIKTSIDNDGTFHAWHGGTGGAKIDFVLVPKDQGTTLSAEIIYYNENGMWPTDHYPVIGKVRF